ncbi:hypothetical protein O3M35_011346 [Rhynocoris fuscipes]|uniref:H15 domain-containing protein n=1 Tax=Rhynocoris fuscipes TaxID=488301 RepID=A0AAW1D0E5_9HEMI
MQTDENGKMENDASDILAVIVDYLEHNNRYKGCTKREIFKNVRDKIGKTAKDMKTTKMIIKLLNHAIKLGAIEKIGSRRSGKFASFKPEELLPGNPWIKRNHQHQPVRWTRD